MIPTLTDPMGLSFTGRQLQYIESTGAQYINTGIAPDFAGGDSIAIRFYSAAYTGAAPCVFGSRESGVRNGVYCLAGSGLIAADSAGYSSIAIQVAQGEHTLSISDTSVVNDGTSYTMPRRVTCGLPIFLFALNNYGTGTFGIYNGMRLYDWKYWRNGTLAQHLIPVLDRSGVPCLYDTVTRTLIYNAGTGTFNYA